MSVPCALRANVSDYRCLLVSTRTLGGGLFRDDTNRGESNGEKTAGPQNSGRAVASVLSHGDGVRAWDCCAS